MCRRGRGNADQHRPRHPSARDSPLRGAQPELSADGAQTNGQELTVVAGKPGCSPLSGGRHCEKRSKALKGDDGCHTTITTTILMISTFLYDGAAAGGATSQI